MGSVPIERLLAHRAWLRGLARSLVRDENRADDLEQETWVAALERPPRREDSPRGWLATVLRRAAGRARTAEGRRAAREQAVARPEPLPAAADLAAHTEVLERLVRAVMDLEEPYRGTILLRYFEGLAPAEIARRTGTPAETVRTRLRRALERLRGRFDRDHRGDRAAWTALLLPVAALPGGRGVPAVGGAASAGTLGVLAMGVKTKAAVAAAAVLLLLGTGWWLHGSGGDPDPAGEPGRAVGGATHETADAAGLAPLHHGDGAAPERKEAPPAPPPDTPPATASAEGARVRLLLLDGDGNPLAEKAARELLGRGAVVLRVASGPLDSRRMEDHLVAAGARPGLYERARVLWDGEEPFLEEGAPEGAWRLFVAPADGVPALGPEFTSGGEGEVAAEIRIPAAAGTRRVRFVAAEDGAPLPGAKVTPWFEYGDDRAFLPGPPRVADPGGEVLLPVAVAAPRQRPPTWWAEAPGRAAGFRVPEDGATGTLEVKVPRTATVKGRAWLSDGTPAAGRRVQSMRKGRVVSTDVGPGGEFVLEGVAADTKQAAFVFLLESVEPLRIVAALVTVVPGEILEKELGRPAADEPGAILRGRVTVAGRPLAGVVAHTLPDEGAGEGAVTDADGRFVLEGVPPGRTGVLVMTGGGNDDFGLRTKEPLALAPGEVREFAFDLPAGVLRVRVVDDATGEPIPKALGYAKPVEDAGVRDRFPGWEFRAGWAGTADAKGEVLLPGLPPGVRHRLLVEAPGREPHESETVVTGTAAAPQEIEVRLRGE